jgi:hypothetical protein
MRGHRVRLPSALLASAFTRYCGAGFRLLGMQQFMRLHAELTG